ncbi:MAG: cytochrome c3 family protein [Nitrospirota bacterium]
MVMGRVLFSSAALLLAASSGWAALGGGDVTFSAPGMASVLYSHEYHVGKIKLRCNECHYSLYTNRAQHKTVGMAAMAKGKSCGACHNGTKAFAVTDTKRCAACHNIQSVAK